MKKKNKKSTPDIPNEMLKRTGEPMVEFLYPLFKTSFEKEVVPSIWNSGLVTCLFKGKGDNEDLSNYRGITTSSSIGTILESMIDNRIEHVVKLSQAQGGGKKGSSCCDHLFILRAIIDTSISEKRSTFITFFDIKKAYDTVDNNDLLVTMWEKGLRGKAWRILKSLNTDLTATIKTRYGLTREVDMEVGGKQGSRLTGRMFCIMMDLISEELSKAELGFTFDSDFVIAVLLWVDDVMTCVESIEDQKEILIKLDEFASKHKLQWSKEKCNIMRVGKHKNEAVDWKLGGDSLMEKKNINILVMLSLQMGKTTRI